MFFLKKRYLLKNGADPEALTTENERPIDLAQQDDFPIISLLLNHMKRGDDDDSDIDDDIANSISTLKNSLNNSSSIKKQSRFSIN